MRVGLFRPLAPEVIGGGYTFEHEIFERLLECAPTSKHEFVVFEDLDGDKATGKTPSLKETPRKRPFSAKQLYAKLRSISRTANSVPRPTYRWENEWISNSLVRERIAADIPGAKQELGDAAMLVNPANEFEIA